MFSLARPDALHRFAQRGPTLPKRRRTDSARPSGSVSGALAFGVAALTLALLGAPASAQSVDLPKIETIKGEAGAVVSTFSLANGLKGVVIEDHRAPVVTHMVWYKVGAADEARGTSGIAHFLEHLMFKGTDDIAPGEFSKIIAANGGQDNAFTSLDYTAYFQRIAKDRLDLVMGMEADRMRDLRLAEQDVLTERDVILEERNTRTDNDPGALFSEQFNAALYLNHPYGVPVIGWRREMAELDRQDALDFYTQFYGPDNATLIVAGDVDPVEVARLAQRHYGALEPSGVGPQPRPGEPPQLAARRIEMEDERVRQPYMMRAYLAPSLVTAKAEGTPEKAYALSVAAEILGGGTTARLQQELVLQGKLALNAGAYYRSLARDLSSFNLYAVPRDGVSFEQIEAAIAKAMARLAEEGPSEQELERAKSVMVASTIYQQDSQSSLARSYGVYLTLGLDIADVQSYADNIRAVTAEQVKDALASLRPEASVTGILRAPQENAAASESETKGDSL
ncbi:MAG: insulinase family protein [Neomegalonema sp.]|nr:insulinase family protein [Neomegalonema sp.]